MQCGDSENVEHLLVGRQRPQIVSNISLERICSGAHCSDLRKDRLKGVLRLCLDFFRMRMSQRIGKAR